jgi:hypothetical protein
MLVRSSRSRELRRLSSQPDCSLRNSQNIRQAHDTLLPCTRTSFLAKANGGSIGRLPDRITSNQDIS